MANETGDIHVHDHGFDDYGTEVVHLDAPYDASEDITALAWDATHRQWTGIRPVHIVCTYKNG